MNPIIFLITKLSEMKLEFVEGNNLSHNFISFRVFTLTQHNSPFETLPFCHYNLPTERCGNKSQLISKCSSSNRLTFSRMHGWFRRLKLAQNSNALLCKLNGVELRYLWSPKNSSKVLWQLVADNWRLMEPWCNYLTKCMKFLLVTLDHFLIWWSF